MEEPWAWGVSPERDEPAQKLEDVNKLELRENKWFSNFYTYFNCNELS